MLPGWLRLSSGQPLSALRRAGSDMALPAHWLCEFDEAACELHMPGMRGAGGAPGHACKAFVVFMAAFYVFAVAGGSLWGGAAVVFLAAAAFSDMDYMIIPDQLLWAAAACALAGACARGCGDAGGLAAFWGGRAHLAGGSAGFWASGPGLRPGGLQVQLWGRSQAEDSCLYQQLFHQYFTAQAR